MVIAEAHSQEAGTTTGKAEVDAVLSLLRNLSSREMCDEVSVNFAFISSKAARKRMVRALTLSHSAQPGLPVACHPGKSITSASSLTCGKHMCPHNAFTLGPA